MCWSVCSIAVTERLRLTKIALLVTLLARRIRFWTKFSKSLFSRVLIKSNTYIRCESSDISREVKVKFYFCKRNRLNRNFILRHWLNESSKDKGFFYCLFEIASKYQALLINFFFSNRHTHRWNSLLRVSLLNFNPFHFVS